MPQVAVQLYTVRDALAADYEGVIRQIAGMGYDGVEMAGMYGAGVNEARALCDSLGLQVPSAHLRLIDDAESRTASLDDAATLGARYAVVPYIPPNQFGSVEQVLGHCERINAALPDVTARGMRLLYHNHAWEFEASAALDGRTPMAIMLENLDEAVGFEVDVFWAAHAGVDPVEVVRSLGDRAPLLHMKDGVPGDDSTMLAAGDGKVDLQAIAGIARADWLICELDRHDGDMLQAVAKSAAYLKTLV
jgi:sugar phosphate isomerase/epimerase